MAIRFDADADGLVRTTDLINYNNPYAIGGQFYFSTDTNAYAYILRLGDNDTDDSDEDLVYLEANGTNLALLAAVGGALSFQATDTDLTAGNWYHLMMVRESVSSLKLYLNGVLKATVTRNITGRTAITRMDVGKLSTSYAPYRGRVAVLKGWTASMTLDEVANEAYTIVPRKLTDVYGWWPCFPGATERLMDYSGNGRNWTAAGTLTDEDPPPVSWGAGVLIMPTPPAAGGTDIPAAGTMAGSSTMTGAAVLQKPAAGTMTGASSMTGAAVKIAVSAGTMTGASSMAGAAFVVRPASGTMTGTSTMTATAEGSTIHAAAATMTGSSTMTGAAVKTAHASGTMTGAATMTSAAVRAVPAAGSMAGSGTMTGAAVREVPAAGTMAGASTMTGAAVKVCVAAANMIGSGSMVAVAVLLIAASATMTGTSTMTVTVTPPGVPSHQRVFHVPFENRTFAFLAREVYKIPFEDRTMEV